MTIESYRDRAPKVHTTAFVHDSAVVIGDVSLGAHSSVWPTAVVRGDIQRIVIGEYTNIQDGCVLHVTSDNHFTPGGVPLVVGDGVTVGHRAVLHACTIDDYCLIGMSATILDGAVLGSCLMLGAGALVPPGKKLEGGFLYVGAPVKQVRPLTDTELAYLDFSAQHYAQLSEGYRSSGVPVAR